MGRALFWSQFCSVFAIFGVVFMFIFGYMFQHQPFYLKGPTDKAAAATSCYSASALYFLVWVGSLSYWSYDSYKNNNKEGEYANLEMSTDASGASGSRGRGGVLAGGRQYGSVAN